MPENDEQLVGTPRGALIGATVGFFVGFAAVSLFGPTAERFKEVIDLSPTLVGFLVSIPMLSGSLLRIPCAAWVDTTGGRKPFLVLLALSIVGLSGLFLVFELFYPDDLSRSFYPVLLLLGALSGCGIAAFSVGIGQVAYWYPQRQQGWALGAYAGFGNLAPGLIAFALPLVVGAWSLVGAYALWLAILVAGTAAYARYGRNAWYFQFRQRGHDPQSAREKAQARGQELFPAASVLRCLGEAARTWRTWPLVVLYFTTFGGFLALTAWLPTYWSEYQGVSTGVAGALTAAFSLLASGIRVPGGVWADRLGGERVAGASLGALLLGALMVTLAAHIAVAAVGLLLVAVGMGVNNAAVFKLVPRYVEHAVGGAAGWVGGLGAFGGFAVPPILGWFVELEGPSGYAHGFIVYVLLALICLAVVAGLRGAGRSLPARPHESDAEPASAK